MRLKKFAHFSVQGTAPGLNFKILTFTNSLISSKWEELKIPNNGAVNKLIIETYNGFTQGYALCGQTTIVQFTRSDDGASEETHKTIKAKVSHKVYFQAKFLFFSSKYRFQIKGSSFIDMAVGSALYALIENRKTIEVFDRTTMNYNRRIGFVSKNSIQIFSYMSFLSEIFWTSKTSLIFNKQKMLNRWLQNN